MWGNKRSIVGSASGFLVLSLILSSCTSHTRSSKTSKSTATIAAHHATIPNSGPTGVTFDVAKSSIAALSCVGSSFCMAASSDGSIYLFNGQSWKESVASSSSVVLPAGIGTPKVDCVSMLMCLGELRGSKLSFFNGNSWSQPSRIPGAEPIAAFGCSSSGSCVAIDAVGDGFLYEKSQWSKAFNAWGSAVSISCISADFCAAAGGGVSFWNGSYWTKPVTIDPNGLLTSISCVSANFCVVVDDKGGVVTWNGSLWGTAESVAAHRLNSISCVNNQWCMAVGEGGEVVVLDNSSWHKVLLGSSNLEYTSVSCDLVSSCQVGDSKGQVISLRLSPQQFAQ